MSLLQKLKAKMVLPWWMKAAIAIALLGYICLVGYTLATQNPGLSGEAMRKLKLKEEAEQQPLRELKETP